MLDLALEIWKVASEKFADCKGRLKTIRGHCVSLFVQHFRFEI